MRVFRAQSKGDPQSVSRKSNILKILVFIIEGIARHSRSPGETGNDWSLTY